MNKENETKSGNKIKKVKKVRKVRIRNKKGLSNFDKFDKYDREGFKLLLFSSLSIIIGIIVSAILDSFWMSILYLWTPPLAFLGVAVISFVVMLLAFAMCLVWAVKGIAYIWKNNVMNIEEAKLKEAKLKDDIK